MYKFFGILLLFLCFLVAPMTLAASGESAAHSSTLPLLWIAVLLVAARCASLIERLGQPSVIGELLIGIALGNIVLLGIDWFEAVRSSEIIKFLAELGVIILLFQIGLESNVKEMRRVGARALLVAVVGVVVPLGLGVYVVGPYLFPGLSSVAYLFLGAALTATSVGITARVFRDLGKLDTPEARIVLGAAVIDDVLGLILLAVVSAIATVGTISATSVLLITIKAFTFLLGSIAVGQHVAPLISGMFSKIHTGIGMKFTLAISFCLLFSYIAHLIGLAPIVGAFAAGLILDGVYFRYFDSAKIIGAVRGALSKERTKVKERLEPLLQTYEHRHVDDLIEPIGFFFVPLFFVVTGMGVDLKVLMRPDIFTVALGMTLAAVAGKYVTSFFAGNVRRSVVGFGMVPRGEVGLIFASIGRELGVVSELVFSVIVIMVVATTLITPIILTRLLRGEQRSGRSVLPFGIVEKLFSRG